MRVAIGADHAGYDLKRELAKRLAEDGHEALDVGAHALNPEDDYADFAIAVGESVRSGEAERGIAVCGTGVGSSVAANKLKGIRASVCHDTYSARQGVEHDNINVLCLGGRIVEVSLAAELVRAFLGARYDGGPRFARRLDKVFAAERRG
ncbi:MAG: ribose 5-phosphate isomerase B [Bryobacterales bacterium]|nr:ribose 5-phosphate isomerase B [Bryobacterales bacterium]